MIAKKKKELNFEGKRSLFFQLGLLTTTAATLAAFTYRSPMEMEREMERRQVAQSDIMYVEEHKEVEEIIKTKPVLQNDDQNDDNSDANPNDQSVDLNSNIKSTDNTGKEVFKKVGLPSTGTPKVGPLKGEIVPYPDKEASFVGGYIELQHYIADEIMYPQIDQEMGMQGVVHLQFVVEIDGSISNIKVLKSVSKSIDREAIRILKESPQWIPGEVKAEPVRTVVQMPIRFVLE